MKIIKNFAMSNFLPKFIHILDKVSEKFNKKFVTTNSKRFFILSFLIMVLSLKFLLSEYRPGYSDPAGDAALIIDGAMNIRDGNGYTFDSIWLFDESDGTINKQISKPAYHYPPMMSFLLSVIFSFTDSIFIAIVFQVFLFILFVFLYFELVSKVFNREIAFFSSLIISVNPVLIFEVVSVPKTHIIGLLMITLFLYSFYKLRMNNNRYLFLGSISGLAYLTRDLNLLLLVSLFIFLFLQSKGTHILRSFSGFLIVTFLWFYRNYSHYKTINPRSTTTGYTYPIFESFNDELFNSKAFLQYLHQFTFDVSSPNMFFFLFPFVLFGILKHIRENDKHFILLYSFIYVSFVLIFPLFDHDTGYRMTYLLPFFIILLPFSLSSFIDFTKTASTELGLRYNPLFGILLISLILISSATIVRDEIGIKQQSSFSFPLEDYAWSKENIDSEANVCTANILPHRYHYFTGSNAVTLPVNLDNQTFEVFIGIYDINYLFIENSDNNYNLQKEPYRSIFSGISEIEFENFTLKLVNEQESIYDGSIIYIYMLVLLDQ